MCPPALGREHRVQYLWHHLSLGVRLARDLGLPTSGDDCHPAATTYPLEAFAGADIGDVETDHAGDWADQLLSKPAAGWSEKSLSPPVLPEVRLDGYD